MIELIAILIPCAFVVVTIITAAVVVFQRNTLLKKPAPPISNTMPDSAARQTADQQREGYEKALFGACASVIQARSQYFDRSKLELLLELYDNAQLNTNQLQYPSNVPHSHLRAGRIVINPNVDITTVAA